MPKAKSVDVRAGTGEKAETALEGLKSMYRNHLKPLEQQFMFDEFYSPILTDADIEAKPLVLLVGVCDMSWMPGWP